MSRAGVHWVSIYYSITILISASKLGDVECRYISNEACIKAIIEDFLSGNSQYKQPSWRALIWSLHKANEIQLAEHIRGFAELVQGTK